MAHISSLSTGKFTQLDYSPAGTRNADSSHVQIFGAFVTNVSKTSAPSQREVPRSTVEHVGDIREFPSLGTPANIVNVPVYGQSISSQVSGQSDAPSLEFTLNYVPTNHAALDSLRRSGTLVVFRVRISDAELTTNDDAITTTNGSDVFDDFYFFGKIASFEVTTGLTDALQATMSLTIEGDFIGPVSILSTASTAEQVTRYNVLGQ